MASRPSWRSVAGLICLVLLVSAASQWWAGRHQRSLGEQVARLARPGDIHMLASDTCAPCLVARGWLARHGVAFSECSIERDAQCRALFDATGARGTPLILVRGQAQLGFSAERVLLGLQVAAKGG
jgi:hypothetical protein